MLTNVFEKLMLIKINMRCPNIQKQFGFTKRSSCGHAVFVLKETMLVTKKNNKKMYATAIDASKAFDKVNRWTLWLMLHKRVGYEIMYLLKKYYDASSAYVINKGETSDQFKTSIGVKQGGPLSPRLFAIYVQDLEVIINSSGIGQSTTLC